MFNWPVLRWRIRKNSEKSVEIYGMTGTFYRDPPSNR